MDWKRYTVIVPILVLVIGWIYQPWGIKGNYLFGIFTIGMIIATISYSKNQVANEWKQKQAKMIQDLAAQKRHDWMNHVQVLLGYTAMKRPDRVQHYLERLVEEAHQERRWTEFTLSELVSFLILIPYTYKRWKWNLLAVGELKMVSKPVQQQVLRSLPVIIETVQEMGANHHDWETIELGFVQEESKMIITLEVLNAEGEPIHLFPDESSWKDFSTQNRNLVDHMEPFDERHGLHMEWDELRKS
ncbi:Spo0B domain-containing protein [Risungbinella massiliensis]|uniref:Spo0B domain-containing protein n=1 Tax=Risungbinella massiliensis TaxID=1329796 RepID=UPI001E3D34C6|nr:Spo0B domain-containing protein [Risungbinella massiliensis]